MALTHLYPLLGFALIVLTLLDFAIHPRHKKKHSTQSKVLAKRHRQFGYTSVGVVLIHAILAIIATGIDLRPSLVMGFVSLGAGIALLATYALRKSIGKKWLSIHKVCAVVFAVSLAFHTMLSCGALHH